MNIRPAVRTDADAIARMHWLSANTAYGRSDPLERRLAAAQRIFDENETRPFLAEDEGGDVIGVLTLGDDELYAIYVHPDQWGTGVGQALLERAERELAETCDVAELTCMVGNARARRFYERNGWELGETLVEPHFGGEPTEVCRYRKRLSSSS
ncbi:MAG TPA: GNAT family N-acetyltransferase [Gaiellaceae bacterium]